jgi:SHS2 domain-containing protein
MSSVPHPRRGHRALSHTADVILEAWGADLVTCCAEALAGLTGLYVEAGATATEERVVHLGPGSAEALLLGALEEVIFTLDTAAVVPIRTEVRAAPDGGLDLVLALAAPETVTPTGAVPKAVSRSELDVDVRADAVRCRFLVDV